ncbi:DUF4232 domain-containing protein [Streptomyces goshikiensis]|uniref:DUF4232 domain-containing protein n=1 Tax=Streptomyces TaxID=1883 RepID=UPI00099B8E30|nr:MULTISPECIES: DUF4232 domain-containing protein [Streptomyces]WBY23274.1 DUF4232 domain-containing protein [Streptomyces goshikiensis]WSS02166.1 DUF4232 domain-containing protein [Streptomyces goshikiensis]WSX96612.1 DUF4232 domain-containing protein [Streptomyces goshikiensis]
MSAFRSTPATSTSRATLPRAARRLGGAAALALAALALTACQDGKGLQDEGAATFSDSAVATPSATATPGAGSGSASGSATKTGSATKSGGAKATGGDAKGSSAPSAEGDRVTCNGSNTAVTVQTVSRPLNHMLITVKNTGKKNCDLTYYPVLRFDEMQWAPAARKDTQPQAVVTLAPGRSGYAGALLSAADGSGEGGVTGHRLTIAFQGRTSHSDGGASAVPSLPAAGVYYDSSLTVTYWQQSASDALGS